MAYTKQTWADLPSKTTPINANRLTHIEDGIFNAAATADNAASAAGTAVSQIGQVSSRVDTLTGRVNGLDTAVSNKVDKVAGKGLSTNDYDDTDKGKVDSLGTASTKNSTSVVTESSDLVESGAVKDIVGWGNKNLLKKLVNEYSWIGNQGGSAVAESGGVMKITTSTVSGTVTGAYSPLDNITSELNGTYTYSFDIKASSNMACDIGFHGRGRSNHNITTEWQRISITSDAFDGITASFVVYGFDGTVHDIYIKNLMVEKGSTATAYEPYHASVEESLAQKCDNSVIAPVENDSTASQDHAVGEHFTRDGAFCTATQKITQGTTLVKASEGVSGNYIEGQVGDIVYITVSKGQRTVSANSSVIDDYSTSDFSWNNFDVLGVSLQVAGSGAYQYAYAQWVYASSSVLRITTYNTGSDARDLTTTAYLTLRIKQ